MNGILFVDKNEDWTSHDAVAKARRVLGTRKIGHAGTLDPMATGLLTLGVGPSTRLLTHMVGLDKTYRATIRLGETTHSDDRTGDTVTIAAPHSVQAVTDEHVRAGIAQLTGPLEQVPSAVSAIKVDGQRSYDRVREGETVELKARSVTVHAFTVHRFTHTRGTGGGPVIDVDVTVHCSSGTYIRALARDLGAALSVGGHLTHLRRTAVGPFCLKDHEAAVSGEEPGLTVPAVTTQELAAHSTSAAHEPPQLTPPATVARALFPTLQLTPEEATNLSHGKTLTTDHEDAPLVAAILPDQGRAGEEKLIGLVSVRKGRTRVVTNFPTPDAVRSAT